MKEDAVIAVGVTILAVLIFLCINTIPWAAYNFILVPIFGLPHLGYFTVLVALVAARLILRFLK